MKGYAVFILAFLIMVIGTGFMASCAKPELLTSERVNLEELIATATSEEDCLNKVDNFRDAGDIGRKMTDVQDAAYTDQCIDQAY